MNFRKGQIEIGASIVCTKLENHAIVYGLLTIGKIYSITGFNGSDSALVTGNTNTSVDNLHAEWELVAKEWDT